MIASPWPSSEPSGQQLLPLVFLYRVQCCMAKITDPMLYLEQKGATGNFRMRVTLKQGRKLVGKRHYINLHTRDLATAQGRRDRILEALKQAGMFSGKIVEPDGEGGWQEQGITDPARVAFNRHHRAKKRAAKAIHQLSLD